MLQDYSKFVELKRVPVIDVPITGTNMSECVEFLTRHIDELHGEYICVSNAHTSVMAHDDPSYWACQADSLMSVPDGKPLSVVGRKTIESMGRVTGPDLMREIFNISLQQGWSHYFKRNIQAWKSLAWSLRFSDRSPTARSETFRDVSLIRMQTSHGLLLARPVKKFLCTSSREGHNR